MHSQAMTSIWGGPRDNVTARIPPAQIVTLETASITVLMLFDCRSGVTAMHMHRTTLALGTNKPLWQGWTGVVHSPHLLHEMVQQWWILPGPIPSKVIQSTSSKNKMPWGALAQPLAMPGLGLPGPVGSARAVQPCLVASCLWPHAWR